MFFKYNRRYNLLDIHDDFAHLSRVLDNGDLEFQFYYNIKPQDAINHEALSVRVSVQSRTIKAKPLLENTYVGKVDTRKLVGNILTQMPDAKSAVKQQQTFNVAVRNSDVSSKINNEIVGQLRAKVPAQSIQQLNRPMLKLVPSADVKEDADNKPLLTQIAHSFTSDIDTVHFASISENPTKLMHDMIVRQGVDPSQILDLTPRSVASVDALGGILRQSGALEVENSPATRLLNFHIFPAVAQTRPTYTSQVSDSVNVQVLVNDVQTNVEIPITITVPRTALTQDGRNSSHFTVKFELINGTTGVAVDTVSRSLDVARHVQLYNTPRRAPIVKVTRSEISTRANLEIKQVDPGATAVQVFRKHFFRAVPAVDDYTLIGTYNVKQNQQSLLVQVDMPRSSPMLYRIVPVGTQGTQGFEYANIVVKPMHYQPVNALSLTAQPIDIGVRLEARHIPQEVVAIEFKARNRTTFETDFHNVGGDVSLIDDSVRTADYLTVVDTNVSPNNIYEYVARLIYESGTDEISGNALVEMLLPEPGKVDTKIDNVVVDQVGDLNVTFNITTTIVNTNADVVKGLLEKQGIIDQFAGDVAREREFLKSLIAHNVQRIDLTSGAREDFGVVTTDSFSDVDLRKNQAVQPLKLGHRYRYEISALLRAPETMFETLVKDAVDQVTKKSYTFSPFKFLHPLTLSRGIILSSTGLRTRYAKDPMAHGAVGGVTSVEVSFDSEPARIVDPAAVRFDKFLNVITWKVQGSIDAVDHFLIMKDVHNVRTLIGKAHSEFAYGNCQYLHPVTRRDEGSFSYVIVPIFNDYKTGAQATTNAVVVEPFPRFVRMVR